MSDPDGSLSRGRVPLVVLVPAVALAVLLAGVVALVLRSDHANATARSGRDALAVARQEAVNITTLSYRHPDADLDRILGIATGALRAKFSAQRAQLPRLLAQEKSESHGTVRSAGLVDVDGSAAQVVVAVDAAVSTAASPTPGTSHYRMLLKLRVVDGHWLVQDVGFVGSPQ